MEDNVTSSYVQGIAMHWYADKVVPPSVLNDAHNSYPEKFILYTEACNTRKIYFENFTIAFDFV